MNFYKTLLKTAAETSDTQDKFMVTGFVSLFTGGLFWSTGLFDEPTGEVLLGGGLLFFIAFMALLLLGVLLDRCIENVTRYVTDGDHVVKDYLLLLGTPEDFLSVLWFVTPKAAIRKVWTFLAGVLVLISGTLYNIPLMITIVLVTTLLTGYTILRLSRMVYRLRLTKRHRAQERS